MVPDRSYNTCPAMDAQSDDLYLQHSTVLDFCVANGLPSRLCTSSSHWRRPTPPYAVSCSAQIAEKNDCSTRAWEHNKENVQRSLLLDTWPMRFAVHPCAHASVPSPHAVTTRWSSLSIRSFPRKISSSSRGPFPAGGGWLQHVVLRVHAPEHLPLTMCWLADSMPTCTVVGLFVALVYISSLALHGYTLG